MLTKIVAVGLVSSGNILTGRRRDNGLWTSPGGHVDPGESPYAAACREVLEEAGIEISIAQLETVCAKRVVSHRTGLPFIVFAFLAHVMPERATAKNDPDQEIAEWKWVPISRDTPELKKEARHAKDDFILEHLGVHEVRMGQDKTQQNAGKLDKDPRDQGRTAKDVSKDLQNAGFNESPEPHEEKPPAPPEPKALTPADLKKDPEEFLRDENATGD